MVARRANQSDINPPTQQYPDLQDIPTSHHLAMVVCRVNKKVLLIPLTPEYSDLQHISNSHNFV